MKLKILLSLLFISFFANAQDGSRDLSFGDDGLVIADFQGSQRVWGAIAYPDESLILGGNTGNQFLLVKFLENGAIDTNFGDGGKKEYAIDGTNSTIVADNSNAIYGYTHSFPEGASKVFKLLPNYEIDPDFGVNGFIIRDEGNDSFIQNVVFDSQNRILMRVRHDNHTAVYRYSQEGLLDPTFGSNGKIEFNFDTYLVNEAHLKILDTDDLLITVAEKIASPGNDVSYIYKFTANGQPILSFGNSGKITLEDANEDINFPFLSIRTDSKLDVLSNRGLDVLLYRFLENGNLDPSFGDNGVFTHEGFGTQLFFIETDSSNRIFAFGTEYGPVFNTVYMTRFKSDGSIDESFGDSSSISENFNGTGFLTLGDSKFIAYGHTNTAFENFVVTRYNNSVLGLKENNRTSFTIFPNPTNDFVTISCAECFLTNKTYQITDATGKVVKQGALNGENPTVSMEALATGLYYLTIENTTVKLVKQ